MTYIDCACAGVEAPQPSRQSVLYSTLKFSAQKKTCPLLVSWDIIFVGFFVVVTKLLLLNPCMSCEELWLSLCRTPAASESVFTNPLYSWFFSRVHLVPITTGMSARTCMYVCMYVCVMCVCVR